jgi:hypothetical protein
VLLLFLLPLLLFPLPLEMAAETLSQCSSSAALCLALAACAAAPSTRVMVAAATEACFDGFFFSFSNEKRWVSFFQFSASPSSRKKSPRENELN